MLRRSKKSIDLTLLEAEAQKILLKSNGNRCYNLVSNFFPSLDPKPGEIKTDTVIMTRTRSPTNK